MEHSEKKQPYTKYVLMLAASFVAMYITMYLNTYELDHVYFSLTRFYMSILGITCMALIMFFFMRSMYKNAKKNMAIILCSIGLFVSALFLVRTQEPIGDVLWMKAMIPHHSIAILTSERANLQNAEVKKLAQGIIQAQKKEIAEMKALISKLQK